MSSSHSPKINRRVGGLALTDDSGADDGKRVSCWMVLINPNIAMTSIDQAERIYSRILGATSRIFAQPDGTKGTHLDQVLKWFKHSDRPWSIDIKEKGEVGSKKGRVHVHLAIKIVHYGRLHLRYEKIKKLYKSYLLNGESGDEPLGISNVFVDFGHYKCPEGAEFYLNKGRILRDEGEIEVPIAQLKELKIK